MSLFSRFNLSDDNKPYSQKLRGGNLFGIMSNDDQEPPQMPPDQSQSSPPMQSGGGGSSANSGGPGFLTKLKNLFTSSDQPIPKDENGIEAPHAPQISTLRKIIQVGLPTLYSTTQGEGVLPGLMAGLTSLEGVKASGYKQDLERYKTQESAQNEADKEEHLEDWRQNTLKPMYEGQTAYHNKMLGVSQQNANTNQQRAGNLRPRAETDSEKFTRIVNAARDPDALAKGLITKGEQEWARLYRGIQLKRGDDPNNPAPQ